MVSGLFSSFRARRALCCSGLLALGLVGGPLTAHTAGATFTTCDTDPMVFLSTGQLVATSAHIEDSASDVKAIVYTVHVPAGAAARAIVHTSGSLSSRETVRVIADNPGNRYDSSTTVYTGGQNIGVSATTAVFSLWSPPVYRSTTGQNGQELSLSITL